MIQSMIQPLVNIRLNQTENRSIDFALKVLYTIHVSLQNTYKEDSVKIHFHAGNAYVNEFTENNHGSPKVERLYARETC